MPSSEEFCLKLKDFKGNVVTAFESLRKDNDFTDVTLVCEDGVQIEAHKVILAASSPFFHNMLKRNKHAHPLLYMRGLKSEDLVALLDFLYFGKANIYQENLNTFLTIAEELELKGLNGGDNEDDSDLPNPAKEPFAEKPSLQVLKNENNFMSTNVIAPELELREKDMTDGEICKMQELDAKVNAMMTLGNNMIPNGPNRSCRATICQVCGKEDNRSHIRKHIEVNHLEGISIPCACCKKIFR